MYTVPHEHGIDILQVYVALVYWGAIVFPEVRALFEI